MKCLRGEFHHNPRVVVQVARVEAAGPGAHAERDGGGRGHGGTSDAVVVAEVHKAGVRGVVERHRDADGVIAFEVHPAHLARLAAHGDAIGLEAPHAAMRG